MHLGGLSHDLVEGRKNESIELDLTHGPVAAQRHPYSSADDARFGKGRIDHSMLAEILLQSLGDPEDAAKLADILSGDDDRGAGFQSTTQARIERLRHGQHGHQCTPPHDAGSACPADAGKASRSPSEGSGLASSKDATYSAYAAFCS